MLNRRTLLTGLPAAVALPAGDMMSAIHGSAVYRAHLVDVVAKRAVVAAG